MAVYPRIRITNDSPVGWKTRIELDGRDISPWLRRFEVIGDPKEFNLVRLELHAAIEISEPALPEVDTSAIRELLIAQGWTPPDHQ